MENKKKLVERKAFVDSVGIKTADLEDIILFLSFPGFCVTMMTEEKCRRLPHFRAPPKKMTPDRRLS